MSDYGVDDDVNTEEIAEFVTKMLNKHGLKVTIERERVLNNLYIVS